MADKPCKGTMRNAGATWGMRRKIILTALLFCVVSITAVWVSGRTDGVSETIVVSSYSLAGAVIGSYVFGAVWDDKQ